MNKKNNKKLIGESLEESLKAEEKHVDDRFARADSIFNGAKDSAPQQKEALGAKIEKQSVRDTFTMPKNEYELIGIIRARLLQNNLHFSKSEVLRGGIAVLSKMPDAELVLMMNMVERIKIGRRPAQ